MNDDVKHLPHLSIFVQSTITNRHCSSFSFLLWLV